MSSIEKLLGISERTLRRRRKGIGLETDGFTEISEDNLTVVVQSVKSLTPSIGQSRMLGGLVLKQGTQECRNPGILKPGTQNYLNPERMKNI